MNGRTTIPGVGGLSSTAAIRIPGRDKGNKPSFTGDV